MSRYGTLEDPEKTTHTPRDPPVPATLAVQSAEAGASPGPLFYLRLTSWAPDRHWRCPALSRDRCVAHLGRDMHRARGRGYLFRCLYCTKAELIGRQACANIPGPPGPALQHHHVSSKSSAAAMIMDSWRSAWTEATRLSAAASLTSHSPWPMPSIVSTRTPRLLAFQEPKPWLAARGLTMVSSVPTATSVGVCALWHPGGQICHLSPISGRVFESR